MRKREILGFFVLSKVGTPVAELWMCSMRRPVVHLGCSPIVYRMRSVRFRHGAPKRREAKTEIEQSKNQRMKTKQIEKTEEEKRT